MCNGERLFALLSSIHNCIRLSIKGNFKRKEIKGIQSQTKEVKLYLFTNDLICI